MAELTTLARPYAKAAFEFARQANDLNGWSTMLAVAANVAQHENMVKLIASPVTTAQDKARTFIDVCGDELNEKAKNFVSNLAANKRLALLPQIYALFENLKAQLEKTVDVKVASAFELSQEQQAKLAKALSAKLDCEVSIESSVDQGLLGGVVIRAGDTVIDGSVRGRLAKLAEAMNA